MTTRKRFQLSPLTLILITILFTLGIILGVQNYYFRVDQEDRATQIANIINNSSNETHQILQRVTEHDTQAEHRSEDIRNLTNADINLTAQANKGVKGILQNLNLTKINAQRIYQTLGLIKNLTQFDINLVNHTNEAVGGILENLNLTKINSSRIYEILNITKNEIALLKQDTALLDNNATK